MRKFIVLLLISFLCVCPALAKEKIKDGIKKTYYKSGELRYESTYKGGKLHGKTKEYDKSGKLIKVHVFKNDELIKTIEKTKLELGKLTFLRSIWFWLAVVGVVGLLWFIFVKVAFKNKAF